MTSREKSFRMKKIILLFIIGLSIFSCSDSDNNDCCVIVDIGIQIKYVNTAGQNLFEIDNGYKASDITIYHKINGEWSEYYKSNLDAPKGISVIDGENGKMLFISPSTTLDENNYSETKIQFSESDFDIIKTEIDKSNSGTMVTKVWYNTVLKWEAYDTDRSFDIVK